MPQDPIQGVPEIGPSGGRRRSTAPSYAEDQYQRQAEQMRGSTGQQAGLLGAGLEEAFSRIPDVRKARYQQMQAALAEYSAKQQGTYDAQQKRVGLGSALDNLKKTQGVGVAADKFAAGLFTPILGGIDTALDVGARLGNVAGTRLGGGDTMEPIPYGENDPFLPGPGLGTQALSGYRPKQDVQSGFLEATTGASTPAEARVQMARNASPLSGPERAHLLATMEEDKRRAAQGLEPILTQQEYEQVATLDDPGLAGMAGDTLTMLFLTPNVGAKAKGALGLAERLAKGAASWGVTRGVTEQSVEAGANDATFGLGMEAAGAAIDKGLGSKRARALLAASGAARSMISRYLGRTAAETAKLRAGRLASSLLEGGETPGEALDASLLEELGPAAVFSTVNARSQARTNRSAARLQGIKKAGQSRRASEAIERNAEAESVAAAERARVGREQAQANEMGERERAEMRSIADELEAKYSKPKGEAETPIRPREVKFYREATERMERGETLSERDLDRMHDIALKLQVESAAKRAREGPLGQRIAMDEARKSDFARRQAEAELRERLPAYKRRQEELQTLSDNEFARQAEAERAAMKPFEQRLESDFEVKRAETEAELRKAAEAIGEVKAPAKKPKPLTNDEKRWIKTTVERVKAGERLTPEEQLKAKDLLGRIKPTTEAVLDAPPIAADAPVNVAANPSADPRDRLTDKGYALVDEFVAAAEQAPDAASYQKLRKQFERKLVQRGKWAADVTPEIRASEASRVLERIDAEASPRVKELQKQDLGLAEELKLLEEMNNATTEKQRAKIQKKLDKLAEDKAKRDKLKVDRRTANQEGKGKRADIPQGTKRKNKKTGEVVTEGVAPPDFPADRVARADAIGQYAPDIAALGREEGQALIRRLSENPDLDIAAEVTRAKNLKAIRDAVQPNADDIRNRQVGGDDADVRMFYSGGPLQQYADSLIAFAKKVWNLPNKKQLIRDFVGHRNLIRQGANYAISHEGERLVNLTPEGPAKDLAVEYDRIAREKSAPAKAEFERLTHEPYAKLVEETSTAKWSKGTEQVTANGSDWHRWEAEAKGYVPASPELSKGIDIYNREYTPTTWNVADDLGLTNEKYRGKKIKPGDPPYLLQVFSDNLRSEAASATKSDWWKAFEKHVESMPENKGVPAKDIAARLDAIRKLYSGDIEVRTATERKVALEFVREVTLPGRFQGKDVTEPRLSEVIKQHYRGASFRAGFEGAFRGREIADMRNEFVEKGGNPNRFDRFIEAAQGTNPRFNDWASRFYAEHPITREIMRVARSIYDFKNTLDLSLSGISAISDAPFGPSAHLFGRRHYKAVGETLGGFAKRIFRLDKRDAWQIAKSAQELSMRVSDRSKNVNAPIGERIEQSARIVRQHIADILFRPMNRGMETASTRAFEMMADDIAKGHKVSGTRKRRIQEFLQWSDDHAKKFFEGRFTTADMRAAAEELSAKLYAASSNPMFRSAALKNPIVRYAFRFASHTTQQLRETVKVLRDLGRAVLSGKDVGFRSSEAAKYLAQQTLKGGGLLVLKALLNGDNVNPWDKDSNLWAKVKNDPLRGIPSMLWDSLWAGGVMGPYAMAIGEVTGMNASPVQEALEDTHPVAAKVAGLAAMTGPVQILEEGLGFAFGFGQYREQDLEKRLRTLVEKRIPGSRVAVNLAVMAGLARGNKDLDNGISAVYRWKRANERTTFGGKPSTEEGHIQMRRELKEGIRKMDGGQSPAEWIATAITAKGDVGAVAESLRSRKVLDNNIAPEDWEELRAEMGEAQFQAVVEHDQLLEEWARVVAASKPEGEPKSKAQAEKIAAKSAQKVQRPGLDERARAAASPRAKVLTDAATELMGSLGTPAASRATERAEALKYRNRRRAATRGMDSTGEEVLQRLKLVRQGQ